MISYSFQFLTLSNHDVEVSSSRNNLNIDSCIGILRKQELRRNLGERALVLRTTWVLWCFLCFYASILSSLDSPTDSYILSTDDGSHDGSDGGLLGFEYKTGT